jgi:SEC-C motif-containing protein
MITPLHKSTTDSLRRVLRPDCPCPSGLPYDACCGRFHRGAERPATAEELMRSRYAAYVVGDERYLLATWHPRTRPESVPPSSGWLGLEVLDTRAGGPDDSAGEVEFVAHHVDGDLRERSRFERRAGRWLYVDGDLG